ncbi:MAG TPA: C1 family peptidase [Bacteroidales bacterium]|nr:C1 family peptidase [Bacteroidales bacterium]
MRKLSNILAISILLWGIFSNPAFAQTEQAEGYQFTDRVRLETSSVKDQHRSGTCWCYATVSFLETELLRMGQPEYDLSEIYLVRHAYEQKAWDYLRFHGHNNFNQGGQAHDAMIELTQHGIVPEKAYPGLEYGTKKHVHGELVSVMTGYVKGVEDNGRRAITPAWDEGFNGILDAYLGKVPETFEYKGESYTPTSFAQSLNIDSDDYVELTSFTHHPWYKPFDLEVPDNWAHKDYYNLPLDELVEVMDNSLQEGYSIVWDGDVSSKGFSHGNGIAVVPEDEGASFKDKPVTEMHITQQYRQDQFNNQTMTDDHLMHLTGIGEDQNGSKYYLTKNSWDSTGNAYDGFLYMSEPYIRLNTVAIMVHKDAIPEDIKEKLNL